MKHTLVIGFGVSGRSAVDLLKKLGKSVLVVDHNPRYSFPERVTLSDVEQVIISPGVFGGHPLVVEARQKGIEVIGEVELAFRYLNNRAVGITGTNGKTTTTLLIQHALQQSGRRAVALGNVGTSLSSYAMHPNEEDILIVELSSFQLETMEKKCLDVALFLNLTPDHLDRYSSFREYGQAKCRIERCLKQDGILWISSQVLREIGDQLQTQNIFGETNQQAAAVACRHFGVQELDVTTFRRPPHRLQFVGEWAGIQFYNDSKATNVDSVRHAVSELSGPIILLAGGKDKGAPYRPWIVDFGGKVKRIVAFGEAAFKIEQELKESFLVHRVDGLREALLYAVRNAKQGEKILLSPGGSSFDQFRNYEHRGEEFCRMIREEIWIEGRSS